MDTSKIYMFKNQNSGLFMEVITNGTIGTEHKCSAMGR